jgi:hypothetical protein
MCCDRMSKKTQKKMTLKGKITPFFFAMLFALYVQQAYL